MGTRLIFLGLLEVTKGCMLSFLIGLKRQCQNFQEIAPATKTVPQTDTGGLVEYTKALERMVMKELGKLTP
jgi:hypothetical protein